MANFTAKIRLTYQDMDGLVLDCRHSDLADNGSLWVNRAPPARAVQTGTHTGSNGAAILLDATKYWYTNALVGMTVYNVTDGSSGFVVSNTTQTLTATLSGGTDNDWDTDDEYILATPRFGNPYQNIVANRPVVTTVGGYKQASFVRASACYMNIPLERSFLSNYWTAAFEFFHGASIANDQVVLGFPQFEILRRNGTGNYGYRFTSTSRYGTGDMDDGTWLLTHLTSATAEMFRNNVSAFSSDADLAVILSGDPAGRIGCTYTGVNFCDMILRTMQIWNRRVSPLEIDFAYKTLSPETDYSILPRHDLAIRVWTDDTLAVPRINPNEVASHKFVIATMTGTGRVQIAAQVDGKTLPDSDLGGHLFSITPIELPGADPAIYQDAGWSSVFDIEITSEGHYTYLLSRADGGSIILHFDAENGP